MTIATKPWRIIDIINWGKVNFIKNNIQNSRRELEWFLCDVMNCERIDLYLRFEELMCASELEKLRSMVKRRIKGEPFQHIIGKAPFYGRDFNVNNSVLIPRPETEIIIDRLKVNGKAHSLLDIGTGSGCIAITVVLENLADSVFATDIFDAAIDITYENMGIYNVENIQIINHDFLKQRFKTKFDVVVSNPPYICKDNMDSLQSEVRNYDPQSALTDDADGLTFYYRLSEQFTNLLNAAGYMLLEFGGNEQKKQVEHVFTSAGFKTEFFKDLQNDWRIVEVRR